MLFWSGGIFSVLPDGSGRRRLTRPKGAAAMDVDPVYCPDRTRVAFAATTDPESRRFDLFVMNADGSGRTQLTHVDQGQAAVSPSWSPDGRRIAFSSLRADGNDISYSVEVVNTNGTRRRHLTGGFLPDWSPDGKTILCTRIGKGRDRRTQLVAADAVTGRMVRSLRKDAAMGAWSPDGRRIAFVHFIDGEPAGLFLMGADGSAVRRLGSDGIVLAPHWTPDGKRVIFTDTGDWEFGPGRADVHIIDADGTHPAVVIKDGLTGGGFVFALWFIPEPPAGGASSR
jgi:Tol biopolymer transport system component